MRRSTLRSHWCYRLNEASGELETLFVRRSDTMENFPGIPSLLSERFSDPLTDLPDPNDLESAQIIFDELSQKRLSGTPIEVSGYLASGHMPENSSGNKTTTKNHTVLDIYSITLPDGLDPKHLNPDFYSQEVRWLTQEGYSRALGRKACGTCVATYYDFMSLYYPVDPYTPPEPSQWGQEVKADADSHRESNTE